jgi:hypothetical protein
MRFIIRVAAKDEDKAWGLLVRHSPGTALPNRTFILSEDAVRALHDSGIKFTVISKEPGSPTAGGKVGGKRI